MFNTSLNRERIACVSSAGRVFVRATQRSRHAQKKNEVAPGADAGALADAAQASAARAAGARGLIAEAAARLRNLDAAAATARVCTCRWR